VGTGIKQGRNFIEEELVLVVFDDNFKGAGDSSGRANQLAHGAPAALYSVNRGDYMVLYFQAAAGANTHAKTAAIAFCFINYWIFRHLFPPTN
jgi:hypothetical protein